MGVDTVKDFNVNLSMENMKKGIKIKKHRPAKEEKKQKVDLMAFCGILRLKEDPLSIQKKLRDEWQ